MSVLPPPGEPASGRSRVLVVDDELGSRESLRMMLNPRYEVATADSAETALLTLGVFQPDLVFMDVQMPRSDGIDLLQRIKRADPSVEVVVVTAHAALETVTRALQFGAFECLIKPPSRDDLEDTAARALARRRSLLGTRAELAALVGQLRETAEPASGARRERAEHALRVAQLSVARELSRRLLGVLDLSQLREAVSAQLRDALGYDEVTLALGPTRPERPADAFALVCPIADDMETLGYLVAANGARPIDPREGKALAMLAEDLAIAIRNCARHGEVARARQTLERLIRSAGDAIITIDRDDRVEAWNPAAARMFSGIAVQAVGRPITDFVPQEPYLAARAAVSSHRPVSSFEVSLKQRDGRPRTLAVTLSSFAASDGGDGMLAIVRDTTAQRELEAQVHQSEKLTALGQMAGGIAHDFNNLLQAILGYAQLMGKNPDNADIVRRGIDVIERAASGGAETVRRIQKFARLRPEEAFVALDIDQVVRDAVAITRHRWDEKKTKVGLPLQLELSLGSVPAVMGRPAELNEVVTNLVLNAIDAMPHGGTLRIETRTQGDGQVALRVSDTGVGMTAEVSHRIFDPFFTTKGEEGTGLGLPVSYSIVKRHGGEMSVESRPGSGTTFTVVLPTGRHVPADAVSDAGLAPPRQGRILLVDNDPQVLSILADMLLDGGHQVVPTGSGSEALRVFARSGFDVVMTNIGMTGMNGWELTQRIRDRDPHVPIVFVTGWGMQERDRARCRSLGVNWLLFKPVRPGELQETVQSALRAGRGPDDGGPARDA